MERLEVEQFEVKMEQFYGLAEWAARDFIQIDGIPCYLGSILEALQLSYISPSTLCSHMEHEIRD